MRAKKGEPFPSIMIETLKTIYDKPKEKIAGKIKVAGVEGSSSADYSDSELKTKTTFNIAHRLEFVHGKINKDGDLY